MVAIIQADLTDFSSERGWTFSYHWDVGCCCGSSELSRKKELYWNANDPSSLFLLTGSPPCLSSLICGGGGQTAPIILFTFACENLI